MGSADIRHIQSELRRVVDAVRSTNPLAPSITNTVTIQFVANAQLAVGGSAAMVYMPDEAEAMARAAHAFYINFGTIEPVYEQTLPRVMTLMHQSRIPFVIDPVGIGTGELRMRLLKAAGNNKPAIVRGNASEIIALAQLWGIGGTQHAVVRGVDTTQSVDEARHAANSIARFTGGAVAVSGPVDYVTDGRIGVRSYGGSEFQRFVTGSGCSLGGVMEVYLTKSNPLIAALAGTNVYNWAAAKAQEQSSGSGSFSVHFVDNLYQATPEDVARVPMDIEAVEGEEIEGDAVG